MLPLLPSYKDGGNTIHLLACIIKRRAVVLTHIHLNVNELLSRQSEELNIVKSSNATFSTFAYYIL